MVYTGRGICRKGLQPAGPQVTEEGFVIRGGDYCVIRQALLERAFHVVASQKLGTVTRQILDPFNEWQRLMEKDVGVRIGEHGAVIEITIPLLVEEEPRMNLRTSVPDPLQALRPGGC